MPGKLYICATPIGNLEDMTYRVVRVLNEVDLIACEDTRHSLKLMNHFDIHTPLTSYHEHNKIEKAAVLVDKMLAGADIALVTDAGTPAISDPGEELVRQAVKAGIEVTSLPGACACITALTMSGLATRRFAFEAFLPYDKKERRNVLDGLINETRTIIIYEAPHHLSGTLSELYAALGDRTITLCRELTKKHEECIYTTIAEAISFYEETEPKGEYVLVIEGADAEALKESKKQELLSMSLEDHMNMDTSQGVDRKEAMKLVAKDRGVSKRDIYNALLEER